MNKTSKYGRKYIAKLIILFCVNNHCVLFLSVARKKKDKSKNEVISPS